MSHAVGRQAEPDSVRPSTFDAAVVMGRTVREVNHA